MLSGTAIVIIRSHRLFGLVMLSGVYSLISALIFVVMDAVDVAFTEAAVGAGVSTLFMLATLVVTGRTEKPATRKRVIVSLVVVSITGAALVWGTLDMPGFGSPDNPVHHHVADRYIAQSDDEIDVPNMVTSVLASYRGFDTLGEVFVVFTALIGVLSLTTLTRREPVVPVKFHSDQKVDHRPYPILQVMTILLLPFILLFALYVQFHGDFGPGGGFQAGVIFATGIILYTLTFGLNDAISLVSVKAIKWSAAFGVLLYSGTGVVSMLLGGNFLNYNLLRDDPIAGQHLGILVIELGVGITVAAAMIGIFFSLVDATQKNPVKS